MQIEIKHYRDLTKDEFHDIISLRIAVFVVEQDCPYLELDGLDKDAWHLMVKDENAHIIGTLRILKEDVVYKEFAIGRVASHYDHRDKKLGYKMMEKAMNFIQTEKGNKNIRLSAQSHLSEFYGKLGFKKTGKEYLEDGIPHCEMLFEVDRV